MQTKVSAPTLRLQALRLCPARQSAGKTKFCPAKLLPLRATSSGPEVLCLSDSAQNAESRKNTSVAGPPGLCSCAHNFSWRRTAAGSHVACPPPVCTRRAVTTQVHTMGKLGRIAELCTPQRGHQFASKVFSVPEASESPSGEELRRWVHGCSQRLLDRTIPSDFWREVCLERPDPLERLCPHVVPMSGATHVLLLVLWSHCSLECSQQIASCLRAGDHQWGGRRRSGFLWLNSLVGCVIAHMLHCRELQGSTTEGKSRAPLLDARSLCLAVRQACELFRVLSDHDPDRVSLDYARHIAHTKPDWRPALKCQIFSSSDVTPHESLRWFVKAELPLLDEVARLPGLAELVQTGDKPAVERSARAAALSLGIDPEFSGELFVAAHCLKQAVGGHDSFRNELFLLHSAPVLGGKGEDPGPARAQRALGEVVFKLRRLSLTSLSSVAGISFRDLASLCGGKGSRGPGDSKRASGRAKESLGEGVKAKKRSKKKRAEDGDKAEKPSSRRAKRDKPSSGVKGALAAGATRAASTQMA